MQHRVLIVEDNLEFSATLASIFEEDLGYLVTKVDNAREAQKLIFRSSRPENTRFDLIVTDMNLKDDGNVAASGMLGGLQVLKSLRQIHESEMCIILSGESLSPSKVKIILADYSDIVSDIIDKQDDVYGEIVGKIHPMVLSNSIRLFLSYRRQDSSLFTDRIYDKLLKNFSAKRVFRDLDSIGGGVDFRQSIREAIDQSNAVLVVIGSQWTSVSDDNGKPRLSDQGDYVRFEVAEALRQNKLIIPVLLDSVSMPLPDQLPVELVPLAFKNAVRIRQGLDFVTDMNRLIVEIEKNSKI